MNLLFFSSVFFPSVGGAQVTLHEMATRLAKANHNVLLVIPLGFYIKNFKARKSFGYTIIPCLPFRFINWGAQEHKLSIMLLNTYFLLLFRIFKIDLVQSFYIYPNGFIMDRICKTGKVCHVTRTVGDDIQKSSSFNYGLIPEKLNLTLLNFFNSSDTQFLALSKTVHKDLTNLSIPNNRIKLFPCGVDLKYFAKTTLCNHERQVLRSELGVKNKDFLFITVGRAHPKKGFDILIKSLPKLKKESQESFKILFVGPDMDDMENLAKKYGVEELCIFYGPILANDTQAFKMPNEKLIKLYKASDACVFPSLLETFALIYIEAMAAGLPVIGTDAPGCGEILSNNIDSLIAKAGDKNSLSILMNLLMSDKNLKDVLIKNGYKLVEDKYDWDNLIPDISDFYKNLIKNNKGNII